MTFQISDRYSAGLSRILASRSALVLVLLLALAVRIGIGVFLGFNSPPDREACGADTIEFENMAWSAAQGKGFAAYPKDGPTAFRAPGYPMMLYLVYKIAGRTYYLNRIALSLIGTATCWLVYLLAIRLQLSRAVALTAAAITALLPLQFYYCGHFMSETPAAFTNVLCGLALAIALTDINAAGSAAHRRVVVRMFLAGAACGIAALVRPAALFVMPCLGLLLLLVWLKYRFRPEPVFPNVTFVSAILLTVVFGAGMTVAIAPWTARNWKVFHRFCPIASIGGSTFWGANNEVVADVSSGKWGTWISTNFDPDTKKREVRSLGNEVDRDRKEMELGLKFVRENPGKVPMLLVGKFYQLLKPFPQSANRIYVYAVALGHIFLLPAFVVGFVWMLMKRGCWWRFVPLNVQLLALVAVTAVFYGSERFRSSYEPFMAIYAAIAVTLLLRTFAGSIPILDSHEKGAEDSPRRC